MTADLPKSYLHTTLMYRYYTLLLCRYSRADMTRREGTYGRFGLVISILTLEYYALAEKQRHNQDLMARYSISINGQHIAVILDQE